MATAFKTRPITKTALVESLNVLSLVGSTPSKKH
jgi:hypothetical protein